MREKTSSSEKIKEVQCSSNFSITKLFLKGFKETVWMI